MSNVVTFFVTILAALSIENAVFTKALGINRWVQWQDSFKNILWYGAVFTWISLFSTMGVTGVISLLQNVEYARYLRAPLFLLMVLIVYVGTFFLIINYLPKHQKMLVKILPITTVNTALFGIFFTILNKNYGFAQSIAYALGTGIGYTIALLMIYYGRKRLALSPVPRAFRGTPILLLYIGLISLALYGLLGYGVGS